MIGGLPHFCTSTTPSAILGAPRESRLDFSQMTTKHGNPCLSTQMVGIVYNKIFDEKFQAVRQHGGQGCGTIIQRNCLLRIKKITACE